MTSATPLLTATITIGLLLAGCASDGDTGGVATLAAGESTTGADDTPASDMDTEEAMLAFAQCMRDEGLDFPDPVVGDDGQLQFAPPGGGGGDGGFDADQREAMQGAGEACGDLLGGLEVGGPGGRGQGEFDADAFLEFAECMRDNGVADFPDPGADGRPDMEAMQQLDPTSESYQAAAEICQDESGFQGPGAGGGGFGGGPGPGGPGGGPGAGA